jgi:putative transcriptional regulator
MAKAGERLLRSVREARAYAQGKKVKGLVVHVPEEIDVKAIRTKLGLSQRRFAEQFGFGYDAVRDWEARRRRPERAARVLLKVIDRRPEVVEEVLAS